MRERDYFRGFKLFSIRDVFQAVPIIFVVWDYEGLHDFSYLV